MSCVNASYSPSNSIFCFKTDSVVSANSTICGDTKTWRIVGTGLSMVFTINTTEFNPTSQFQDEKGNAATFSYASNGLIKIESTSNTTTLQTWGSNGLFCIDSNNTGIITLYDSPDFGSKIIWQSNSGFTLGSGYPAVESFGPGMPPPTVSTKTIVVVVSLLVIALFGCVIIALRTCKSKRETQEYAVRIRGRDSEAEEEFLPEYLDEPPRYGEDEPVRTGAMEQLRRTASRALQVIS
ncbi:hypothetical protein HDU79_010915 [Rhizoclosmatium sp. JEL0117]|nr:hypothetical protein HDU79_010915 [Rhizoclosmatium sp. JEL0117]